MLRRVVYPLGPQDSPFRRRFFEGWYFKEVSKDGSLTVSFIPGYSRTPEREEAFLQYIVQGPELEFSGSISYPLEAISFRKAPFTISLGESSFGEEGLILKEREFQGKISFGPFTPIRRSLYSPTIMGPFAYIPGMECNHGVLSMGHSLEGSLRIRGKEYSFQGGRGYLEKDWGSSFPRGYRWLQCSHFDGDASLFFSEADIPFGPLTFRGFLCIFRYQGEEHRFATYNGSRCEVLKEEEGFRAILTKGRKRLELRAYPGHGQDLRAPREGDMGSRLIKEAVNARIEADFHRGGEEPDLFLTGYPGGYEEVEQES